MDNPHPSAAQVLRYRLCPQCGRAVPASSRERHCVNDGVRLLDACPSCGEAINTPFGRYCAGCGRLLVGARTPPEGRA